MELALDLKTRARAGRRGGGADAAMARVRALIGRSFCEEDETEGKQRQERSARTIARRSVWAGAHIRCCAAIGETGEPPGAGRGRARLAVWEALGDRGGEKRPEKDERKRGRESTAEERRTCDEELEGDGAEARIHAGPAD